ncbi:MAG: helix-turn-helix domain-containing protein [Candidatus Coproplasma sp.]
MENKYGLRLKELREERQLKQAAVAERLNIRQNTYSQYENGLRQLPIEILIELANIYGVSTDYILGLTDIDEPYPEK